MFKFMKSSRDVLWSADEAAALTGGTNTQKWAATGVCINIEELQPGDVFFAAHGDDMNSVFAKGAVAAVIPHNMPAPKNLPCLKVANTYEALRSFAGAARFKTHATVISVQGEQERASISKTLSGVSSVHAGGKHMSVGLAGLPDNVEYGVFGFSPAVAPDIVVINDPEKATHSRIFGSMAPGGLVLMNDNAYGFVECFAAVTAAGIQNIMTFSEVPVSLKSMKDKRIRKALGVIVGTLSTPVVVLEPEQYTAFQVRNMIDLGVARKTLVLEGISEKGSTPLTEDLEIPRQIENVQLVCTSKKISLSSTMHKAVQRAKDLKFKNIVPEVLTPGDYLVFKKEKSKAKIKFLDALRFARDGV